MEFPVKIRTQNRLNDGSGISFWKDNNTSLRTTWRNKTYLQQRYIKNMHQKFFCKISGLSVTPSRNSAIIASCFVNSHKPRLIKCTPLTKCWALVITKNCVLAILWRDLLSLWSIFLLHVMASFLAIRKNPLSLHF